jgi:hypothetical protein
MSPESSQPHGENDLTESARRWREKYAVRQRYQSRVYDQLQRLLEGQRSGRVTDRKTRLLICACVREGLWHLLTDARSRAAIEIAELFADGRATIEELTAAKTAAGAAASDVPSIPAAGGMSTARGACSAAWAVTWSLAVAPSAVVRYYEAAGGEREGLGLGYGAVLSIGRPAPRFALDELLAREFADIVGPDRMPTVDPAWVSWNDGTVVQIAHSIYERRDFSLLPILGDALEDAGCNNEDIITHCRSEGLHARGCWVLDLLLGQQ